MPGVIIESTRFLLRYFFKHRFNLIVSTEDFDTTREEPYFLVSNHQQLNDPLIIGIYLKYYPYPVASNTLYTNPALKFALTKIVKSIPKRKGQADTKTIRQIRQAFFKDKRGIQICPEGNASYFGEQTKTDFTATAKLIKKLKFDLVIGQFRGGYFAHPRWANHYRKKAPIYLHYKRLIRGEDLDLYQVEELAALLEKEIAFNDYEWNKHAQITYKQNNKAEGSENFLYACPKCHSIQTISSKGDDIYCDHCGKIASIDEHHMYHSAYVKDMIEWGSLQQTLLKPRIDETFHSEGKFYELLLDKQKRCLLEKHAHISLSGQFLVINMKKETFKVNVKDINGMALTQQNKISFDYGDKTYLMKMKHSMLFLDLINMKKGEQS